ncbi:hypothetical protein [Niabella ginsengisoli]|uniref:Uncharacterized protein n=1 Tax=Niabella ginsengisoli TaxID=522298 RepID=A0ABS9SIK3_9BACT|nr:hypothetical protein [Niabella ginsengisoli]MCH5598175.1 hypothetical protein [Niabella ginsengisoli]
MKEVIRTQVKGAKNVMTIGSGGNINKVFSLSKRKKASLYRSHFCEIFIKN